VPGRGDNYAMFRFVAWLWRLFGFKAKVWRFDWLRDDGKFDHRFNLLLDDIDALPFGERACIIGCSAGGVVALSALLARPKRVLRIVTVAAPLARDFRRNHVLTAAYNHMRRELQGREQLLGYACAIGGHRDQMVPWHYCHLRGMYVRRNPGWSHNSIIALATTLAARPLVRWLKHGKS
jgi:pimeloyl-ACP methyl ester carboxylesterase